MKGWKNVYTIHNPQTNPTGNMICTSNYSTIFSYLKNIPTKMPHIKNVVIDDSNYLLTQDFMGRVSEKGYEKFTDLAANYFNLINAGINMPDNINFIVIAHAEISENTYRLKTLGKMINEKITPQGYFTYCFVSSTKTSFDGKSEYGYFTNTTRDEQGIVVPAKSPAGIFEDLIIPNDLGLIVEKIEEFKNG